ncbi:MAG TPA: 2'-5' RNA ligase family protein [Cyclobacteriaceae bacterium]|nr:2'-5' RNA ligase family protein [Cyclobacteriaceae bacterium]
MSKYLIAIIPPEPVAGDIYRLKEYFRDKYNSKASLNSPAHITMHMPFEFDERRENELFEALPLKEELSIELDGFNVFAPRVIFIDVKPNPALTRSQKELIQFCKTRLNVFNADYKDQPFHAHVTLAFRDLKKDVFTTAWEEFKSKSYHARFECNRLSLLKHDGKFWREFS